MRVSLEQCGMRVLSSLGVLALTLTVSAMGCVTTGPRQETEATSPQAVPDAVILVKGMT